MNELLEKGWTSQDNKLSKVFEFKGFNKTMGFVNAVAWLANQQNHHPDMKVTFKTCTIELTTHDEDNTITDKDIKLASSIEALL